MDSAFIIIGVLVGISAIIAWIFGRGGDSKPVSGVGDYIMSDANLSDPEPEPEPEPEPVPEPEPEPAPVEVKIPEVTFKKKDLEAMTKRQIEEAARSVGIELDRRLAKAKLIKSFLDELKKR